MTTPAAPYTLTQQLTPQTETDLQILLLSLLQGNGFPAITEWAGEPTGTEMTFVNMVCQAINQLAQIGAPESQQIASVAAGRTLRWAKGGWLDLLAEQVYLLSRQQATATTFSMTLVSSADADPYTLEDGDVWITGPTGYRYQSKTGGTLQPGGTLEMRFQAEHPGSAYADDPQQTTLQLVTSLAGVHVIPGGGDFSIVTNSGGSTGSIQPQRTNPAVAPAPHSFSIQIDVAGEVGAAVYSLKIDDGFYVPSGILGVLEDLGDGASIIAGDGAAPSFIANDVFIFSTPGTPNYVQGNDVETDASLAARCQARWPSLSLNVLDAKAVLWVVTAYPGANRVSVAADTVIPGRFIVTVADSHGGVDQASLDVIEAYIKPRLGKGEDMGAVSATTLDVWATGNVAVPASTSSEDFEAIQNAADLAWKAYLATVPIGGEVLLAKLVEVLMDAGALDVGNLASIVIGADPIVGAPNLQLDAGQVPVAAESLLSSLTWGYG